MAKPSDHLHGPAPVELHGRTAQRADPLGSVRCFGLAAPVVVFGGGGER